MVKTKKFNRIAAMLLALVMLLTVVPFQSFAAGIPVEKLVLKDGVTVALSDDMDANTAKKALFDALVENPEGANWQDYEWEYYCKGQWTGSTNDAAIYDNPTWGSINGFSTQTTIFSKYNHHAIWYNDNRSSISGDGKYEVRLAGTETSVTIQKVASCEVTYNYDALQGSVLIDGAKVSGTVTGLSAAKAVYFTVAANAGYEVESVKANGVELQADNGVYSFVPVASTAIDVTFKEIGTLYDVTINAGEGVTVALNGNPVSGTVKVSADEKYTLVYTPDENTSVKSVKLGDKDVTSDVSFTNYVGTQYVTFTGDSTLNVETVSKNDEFVLTDAREVGIVINTDGSWNYDGIRTNIINALVDQAQSVGVDFTQDNVEVTYWNCGRVNGQYVALEWSEGAGEIFDGQKTFKDAVADGTVNLRLYFKGNDQFRPTEYVYADYVTFVDVQTSVIALKDSPVVVLEEGKPGIIDYTNLEKKVYDAAIDAENSLPQNMKFEDMRFTIPEVKTSGTYKVTAKYIGSTSYYASEKTFDVYFKVDVLPDAEIVLKSPEISTVLNETKIGEFDVEALKKSVFDLAVNAEASKPVLSYDDVTITFDGDVTKGGKFTATIAFEGSADYHGTSTTVIVNVALNLLPTVKVDASFGNLVLNRTADGGYDYDALKQAVFDKCLTVSGVEGLTWKDFNFMYMLRTDGAVFVGQDKFYDFSMEKVGADLTNAGHYLYKGGNFEIQVSIPDSANYHGTTVNFNINVEVAKREDTKVVLKSGTMDFTGDLAAVKAYIFNNLINFDLSNLPADVTVDDFSFEYYATVYLAGGNPGLNKAWVPFEGKEDAMGAYYKPIGNGTNSIRVHFNGNEEFKPCPSNEATLTMPKSTFEISLNQNYKYLDEDLPADFVKTSAVGDFEHYYFAIDASSDTAVVYIDSSKGLDLLDFTGNITFSCLLTDILGTGVTAEQVYKNGLSRDQVVKLLSDSRMIDFLAGYNMDAQAVSAILEVVNSVPENVTRFTFQMDQPTKPGVYTMLVVSTSDNFYTAVSQPSVFYVKFHSKGTKLLFVQDTANLTAKNAATFDFSAVVTKDGVPIESDNVRYIYTGFRANALLYASTSEPPRQAGIYTQTAWTFLGTYAFPKTRTFVIPISIFG